MAEPGFAVEFNVDPQGSELDVAATATDTLLYLGDASDYDAPGTVRVDNGTDVVDVDIVSVDIDAATITLGVALGIAADVGDRVFILSADEVAVDHTLVVHTSDGDSVEIPVDYADRALWEEGPQDPPVPVLVSDDLAEIVDVPGRRALVNPSNFVVPMFVGYLNVNQSIPTGLAYTTVSNWVPFIVAGGMVYDPFFMTIEVPLPGYYSMTSSAATWAFNATGRRAVQPWFSNTPFGAFGGAEFKQDASATATQQATPVVTPFKQMDPGWRVSLQVSQTSGGNLDLIGDPTGAGVGTFFCVKYEGPA